MSAILKAKRTESIFTISHKRISRKPGKFRLVFSNERFGPNFWDIIWSNVPSYFVLSFVPSGGGTVTLAIFTKTGRQIAHNFNTVSLEFQNFFSGGWGRRLYIKN